MNVNFMEISAENFLRNIYSVKKLIGSHTKLCIVMKSDAYGHGIKSLISVAIQANPDYIGVTENIEIAIISEYLKKANNKFIKILRLAPATELEIYELLDIGCCVEEITGSWDHANLLSKLAIKFNRQINVHLYIETGMCRMGTRDFNALVKINNLPNICIVGIMTHLSNAHLEGIDNVSLTKLQIEMFTRISEKLNLKDHVIRHVANSASTIKFDWSHLDMVRVGDCLYASDISGLNNDRKFKSVFQSIKTSVAMVTHNIQPCTPVGYGGIQRTDPYLKSILATIRIGYNCGIPRDAYKYKINVLIRGQRFPIIGYLSMNLAVIDITRQSKYNLIEIGDEVVIIGKQDTEEITLEEFATKIGKSITEIITQVGVCLPKIDMGSCGSPSKMSILSN